MELTTQGKLFQYTGEFLQLNTDGTANDDGKNWYVAGYASTPSKDLQGEYVDPEGIDMSYFVKHGWINYDHQQGPKHVVGEPTGNCYIDSNGMHIEALLYKSKPEAQAMWELALAMKNSDSERRLGFSIEGYITSRDSDDKNHITGVKVINVAITDHPANPEAQWDAFVKSYSQGYPANPEADLGTDSGVLSAQQLGQAIFNLASAMRRPDADDFLKSVQKDMEVNGLLDEATKCVLLQLGRGISKDDAQAFLNNQKENS